MFTYVYINMNYNMKHTTNLIFKNCVVVLENLICFVCFNSFCENKVDILWKLYVFHMWLQCPKHKTIKTIICQKHVLHLQLFLDQSKLKTKCLCAWKSHHFWVSSGTMAPKKIWKQWRRNMTWKSLPRRKAWKTLPRRKAWKSLPTREAWKSHLEERVWKSPWRSLAAMMEVVWKNKEPSKTRSKLQLRRLKVMQTRVLQSCMDPCPSLIRANSGPSSRHPSEGTRPWKRPMPNLARRRKELLLANGSWKRKASSFSKPPGGFLWEKLSLRLITGKPNSKCLPGTPQKSWRCISSLERWSGESAPTLLVHLNTKIPRIGTKQSTQPGRRNGRGWGLGALQHWLPFLVCGWRHWKR